MRGVGLAGVDQTGVGLVDAAHAVVEGELRVAVHDLRRGELLVRDAGGPHRARVLVEVLGLTVPDRFQVEAAGRTTSRSPASSSTSAQVS